MSRPEVRRVRDERGAIAIIVALLTTVLFASAALAVDMGSAWARKRDVQKQVDLAVLSAGYLLPMTSANRDEIAAKVATSLESNRAIGQGSAITASQLLNGSTTDGEVVFQNADGSACSDSCVRMRLVTPRTEVKFGLARAIGVEEAVLQRDATVQVMGTLPGGQDMLPFWLPSGCALGPAQADTSGGTNGNGASASSTPSASASASSSPSASPSPAALPVGTHQVTGPNYTVAANVSQTVNNLKLTNIDKKVDRSSLRFYAPNGAYYIEYAARDLKNPSSTLDVAAFQVSTEVTATPGVWHVFAVVQLNKQLQTSQTHLSFEVTAPASTSPSASASPSATATPTAAASSIPVGCVGQDRGNFGQLDSPRKDMGSGQTNKRLAMNIAEGLDHQLVPFVFPSGQPVTKDCGSPSKGFIAGAAADNVATDGRNCIKGDTGNDGPAIFDGLVYGTDGHAGRLNVSRPGNHTTCPGRSDLVIGSSVVNNDVLSCFLRGGATLSDIARTSGVTQGMLDPAVINSPRFVWLPVVYATDRAQKDFQPILEFIPAFITDETQTTAATPANGLDVNGNSVSVLRVFCFSRDALPQDIRSATTAYSPTLRSVVRLVG